MQLQPPSTVVYSHSRQAHRELQASIQRELEAINSSWLSDTEMGGVPVALASSAAVVLGQLGGLRLPLFKPFALNTRADAVITQCDRTLRAAVEAAAAKVAADALVSSSALVLPSPEWVDDTLPLRELDEVRTRGLVAGSRLDTLRRPLSRAEASRVDAALAPGDDSDPITTQSIAGIKLARRDTRTLRAGAWLNDEVMNLYFELLIRRHAAFVALREATRTEHLTLSRPGPPPPRLRAIHIFTTFFWYKLNQVCSYKTAVVVVVLSKPCPSGL